MTYRVFISHGWHDRWIAKQMASLIAATGVCGKGASMTHKVFLSYARGDRELAKVLGERMRALGADVFDDQTILPGDDWQKVFREALEAADAVVYLAPNPGTAESNFAFFEVGAARALGKRIIPILPSQDAMRIRELPAGIQTLQALDGSRLAPDALAESIVATLDAA